MRKDTLSCKSFESASDVLDLAICSNHLPREMNRNSMGGVSKKVIGEAFSCIIMLASTTPQLYVYAIVVARTTNTSIFVVPCLIAAQAYQYNSIFKFEVIKGIVCFHQILGSHIWDPEFSMIFVKCSLKTDYLVNLAHFFL